MEFNRQNQNKGSLFSLERGLTCQLILQIDYSAPRSLLQYGATGQALTHTLPTRMRASCTRVPASITGSGLQQLLCPEQRAARNAAPSCGRRRALRRSHRWRRRRRCGQGGGRRCGVGGLCLGRRGGGWRGNGHSGCRSGGGGGGCRSGGRGCMRLRGLAHTAAERPHAARGGAAARRREGALRVNPGRAGGCEAARADDARQHLRCQ